MKRVASVLLAALFSFQLGCAHRQRAKTPDNASNGQHHYVLHVDDSFGSYTSRVLPAFQEWETASNGVVRFEQDPVLHKHSDELAFGENDQGCTDDVYVINVAGDDPLIKEIEDEIGSGKAEVLGYTHSKCFDKRVYLVGERLTDKTFNMVAAHEAGHLIGLAHVPIPNESLMFPSADMQAPKPTELDMKQFCLIEKCDWRSL